jgi:hypothetical protein
MPALFGSPLRNLLVITAFLASVTVLATGGYMIAGWSLGDAFYMVVLTIYTVGFREVRPIDRPGGEPIVSPAGEMVIQPGDGLVVVGRSIGAFPAVFGRAG